MLRNEPEALLEELGKASCKRCDKQQVVMGVSQN